MIKQQRLQDLIASNNKIKEMKQSQLAEAAKAEEEEFKKILKEQIEENEKIKEAERRYKQKLFEHNFEFYGAPKGLLL